VNAEEPDHLAGLLIRAEGKHPQDMERNEHHHEARAPVVHAADKVPERCLFLDIFHACIRVVGRGHIIHGKEDAGQHLEYKDKEKGRPQHIEPARPSRNGTVRDNSPEFPDLNPLIHPINQSFQHDTPLQSFLQMFENMDRGSRNGKSAKRVTHSPVLRFSDSYSLRYCFLRYTQLEDLELYQEPPPFHACFDRIERPRRWSGK
jgi:hypothetical protein